MTYQEQQDYNDLTPEGKIAYDRSIGDHPSWCHSQHLAQAKFLERIGITIGNGQDINKPEVVKDILVEVREWLGNACAVSFAILSVLDNAISELGRAIGNGIRWIGNKIGDLFDWIFS